MGSIHLKISERIKLALKMFGRIAFAWSLLLGNISVQALSSQDIAVIGTFSEWSIYHDDYGVTKIPAQGLTHVIYENISIDTSGNISPHDSFAAYEYSGGDDTENAKKGTLNHFIEMKKNHPHLKTIAAIGGWGQSENFSEVLSKAETRNAFVQSTLAFLAQYQFDGILLDWRYVGNGATENNAKINRDIDGLVKYFELMRRHSPKTLLALTLPATNTALHVISAKRLNEKIDFFNVMTFDMAGFWQKTTGHVSPLYSSTIDTNMHTGSIDSAVQYLIKKGVDSDKIIVNISAMASSWAGVPNINNGLYQKSQYIPKGSYDVGKQSNTGRYNKEDMQTFFYKNGYQYLWDEEVKAGYIYSVSQLNGHFISYEDNKSLGEKVRYIREHALKGININFLNANPDIVAAINNVASMEDSTISDKPYLRWGGFILMLVAIFIGIKLGLSERYRALQLISKSEEKSDENKTISETSSQENTVTKIVEEDKTNTHLNDLTSNPSLLNELNKISSCRKDLLYIKGEKGYSGLYCEGKESPDYVYSRLKNILSYFDFLVQVHRSYLVNSQKIVGIRSVSDGKYVVELEEFEVPVGGMYLNKLKEQFPGFFTK